MISLFEYECKRLICMASMQTCNSSLELGVMLSSTFVRHMTAPPAEPPTPPSPPRACPLHIGARVGITPLPRSVRLSSVGERGERSPGQRMRAPIAAQSAKCAPTIHLPPSTLQFQTARPRLPDRRTTILPRASKTAIL